MLKPPCFLVEQIVTGDPEFKKVEDIVQVKWIGESKKTR
jgi:hypothetical protein